MDSDLVRILLVDDDEEDCRLTRDLLSEIEGTEYKLEWEPDYPAALELASGDAHDVYLVDYDLGLHSGLDLLEEAMAQGCTAPMIVLTGMGDRSVDNAAMMAGAADYLLKGHLDASMLEMAIRYRARGPSRNERLLSSSSGRPKRWRRSASSQVASLTTSITCSPRSLGTRRLVSFKHQTRARLSPASRKSVTLPGGRLT